MARQKRPDQKVAVRVELDEQAVSSTNAASHEASAADMAVVNATQALLDAGEMRGLEFVKRVSDVALAQKFVRIKNSKEFMGLAYRSDDGSVKRISNLDEYCDHFLGKGAGRMYQLAANLHLLGPELYEQAERIGFRASDYRALKALPAPDQEAVKEAMESGDRARVLNVLEQLATVNDSLKAQHEESAKLLAAKDRVIAKKDVQLNKLTEDIELRKAVGTDHEATLALLGDATRAAKIALMQLSTIIGATLSDAPSGAALAAARHAGEYTAQLLADLINQHGIPVDFQEMVNPSWLKS